ncbi:hypothetical protein C9374_006009 [Naegleria lovaniensis]|uniref:Uncharacterized protein n=1 Tax=Naegleria lovaniensis TaxID=51637 RepID=A0AA88GK54_NAELO|nr:uncharacterized protein C9374_006009 [Naegleria lovaniensis]KAG2381625.1 hypothetical protein C9374_006009 [Naegleria lovaniensis]
MVCKSQQSLQQGKADRIRPRRTVPSNRNDPPVVNVHIEREVEPHFDSASSDWRRRVESASMQHGNPLIPSASSNGSMPETPLFYNCNITFHVNHFLTNVKCGEPSSNQSSIVRRKKETVRNQETVLGKRTKVDQLSDKSSVSNPVKTESQKTTGQNISVMMEEDDETSMEEGHSENEESSMTSDEELFDKNFVVSDSNSDNGEDSGLETTQPSFKQRKLV